MNSIYTWCCLRLYSLAGSWSDQGAPLQERDLSTPRLHYRRNRQVKPNQNVTEILKKQAILTEDQRS